MVSKIRYARPTSQRASLTLSRSADQAILNNEVNCPANFTLSSGDQRAEACRTLTQKVKAFPLVTNQRRMLASARSPWHDNARTVRSDYTRMRHGPRRFFFACAQYQ